MAHGHSASHSPKKKKKKGTKFPWAGILALWVVYSTFDFHPVLGIVAVVTLGLIPPVAEAIMYPFQKLSEMEDKKKEGAKKDHHAHNTGHH